MRILKTAALAIAAAGLLGGAVTFTSAPAKAQGVSVDIGGPGVHFRDRDDWRWRDRDDWRWRHHRGWRAEAFESGCRTIVRREWRGHHEVVIRRRICD